MNKSLIFVSLLSASTLLTGCVGTGPSTEAGAITGAALGGLAGAILGHNSRGGDAVGGAMLGAVGGAFAGGMMGNSVDHERGTIYGAGPDDRGYRVAHVQQQQSGPPPAPVDVMPPQPASNAVWAAGYWIFDGRTYTWMAGHWEVPPPLARAYVAAHWENRNGQSVFVPGYWQQ